MQLQHRLEGHEEQQLIVGVTFYPILRGCFASRQSTWLFARQKRPDATGLCIEVQKFGPVELDLIGDIHISAGKCGTLPAVGTPACLFGRFRVNSLFDFLDQLRQSRDIVAGHLVDFLAVPEEHGCREFCDAVGTLDRLHLVHVDLCELQDRAASFEALGVVFEDVNSFQRGRITGGVNWEETVSASCY